METNTYKIHLKSLLSNNKLKEVLKELRKITPPNSVKYKDLLSIAFNFHNLQKASRNGTLKNDLKAQELNKARSALYKFIDELEDQEIFFHEFELVYSQRTENNGRLESNEGEKKKYNFKDRFKVFIRKIKYLIISIAMAFLFLVDGTDFVRDIVPDNGRLELIELRKEANYYLYHGDLNKTFDLLFKKIDPNSEVHQYLTVLKGRFVENEDNFKSGVIDDEEYFRQRNNITNYLLEILDDITTDDLTN